ncbi:DNA polymerase epsilon subunit 3 [Caerostris darwini]|uniref:DNA polymerase epsilon subunit 3 n=1 Tax=Caerostris darwini TaxID=1538125 RepID=A0AAV4TY10_9ARAC|nr:DNA polymerase epsilon subunit 3 [Caerostris darwini]
MVPSESISSLFTNPIPEGINVSKEARSAITRAASVFILYTTACASQVQAASLRKTLAIQDVYTALEDMLFEDMIDPIKESLEAFHADKGKKDNASNSPTKPKRKRSQSTKDSETVNILNINSENTFPDFQMDDLESINSIDVITT